MINLATPTKILPFQIINVEREINLATWVNHFSNQTTQFDTKKLLTLARSQFSPAMYNNKHLAPSKGKLIAISYYVYIT